MQVTDQPRIRPDGPVAPNERHKHVILSLVAPSSAHAADTVALVSALFPFIDSLAQVNLRPETKNKLKKIREDLDKNLKADSEREKNEEVELLRSLIMLAAHFRPARVRFLKQPRTRRPRNARRRRNELQNSRHRNRGRQVSLVRPALIDISSPAQILEKERKRNIRKSQGKAIVRK